MVKSAMGSLNFRNFATALFRMYIASLVLDEQEKRHSRRVSLPKLLRRFSKSVGADKKRNKVLRKLKKSVPGVMKRDKVEQVRSIHNAQDILEKDPHLFDTKKPRQKESADGNEPYLEQDALSNHGSSVCSDEDARSERGEKSKTVKLAFSADSADRRGKKRDKYKSKLKNGKRQGKGKAHVHVKDDKTYGHGIGGVVFVRHFHHSHSETETARI